MAKKFYAVRKGKVPGIYETWAECQAQINGFSGAEYKGFSSTDEANAYMDNSSQLIMDTNVESIKKTEAAAYVDGSYNSNTNQFSCGVVMFYLGNEQHFSEVFNDPELAEMNNVAGELKGAEKAIQFCLDNGINSLTIYHDYEGIEKWCTGKWQAKKNGTKAYKDFYDLAIKKMQINFVKVKGHSGDKYNELADRLAKSAFNLKAHDVPTKEEKSVAKRKGVFIDRTKIKELVVSIGIKHWECFEASDLILVGNLYRCNITADQEKAMLNFFFNSDGSTTISPTGTNMEISSIIKATLEKECAYENPSQSKSYSFKNIPQEWITKLIEYLKSLEDIEVVYKKVEAQPPHDYYQFTSKIGDKLTINIYRTGTLTLQGKPAYLYSEAISLLSYCNEVSIDDIVDTINSFHNIDIKITDVRSDLETLLPRAYNNIDDMILKLLSPSISLRKVKMELEDYSCYAFPALRALEGYIKYLFGIKGIAIGYTFGGIFKDGRLIPLIAAQIDDTIYQSELERLYGYFVSNRHVIFHTEQILIGTTLLEDKHEADEIVNTVLNLIETSYTNINK